jgi:hypothetical protein
MVMMFSLITTVKEWIDEYTRLLQERVKAVAKAAEEEEERRAMIKLEEVKVTHREGTPVNEVTFAAWRIKFDEGMRLAQGKSKDLLSKKSTGKQLFESDASLFDSSLFDADMADLDEGN